MAHPEFCTYTLLLRYGWKPTDFKGHHQNCVKKTREYWRVKSRESRARKKIYEDES